MLFQWLVLVEAAELLTEEPGTQQEKDTTIWFTTKKLKIQ